MQTTYSTFIECAEDCFNEGQIVTYECQVPAVFGTLDWNGVGFDCPDAHTISNNALLFPTAPCPLPFANEDGVYIGVCGPYFGNLTCTEDGAHLISVLEFEANYEMNGGNISCKFLNTNRIETFPVRVRGKINFTCQSKLFYFSVLETSVAPNKQPIKFSLALASGLYSASAWGLWGLEHPLSSQTTIKLI